jgi:hypothetical protein
MNITLRKANTLQNAIAEAIKQIKIQTSVTINEFEVLETKLNDANKELFANDKRRSDLLVAQFSIRGLVGSANATSGVDSKLTQAAYIDKRISQLTDIVGSDKQISLDVIKGKLDKIRNRKEESRASLYGREDDVTTPVQTADQLDAVKTLVQDLRKQKQKLNDEILELNVRTEISLTNDIVEILKKENLL